MMPKASASAKPDAKRGNAKPTHKSEASKQAKATSEGAKAAAPAAPAMDEETLSALTLYNTYVVADREQRAHERAVRKAEKAKDDAAARVRKLNEHKVSSDETAAAEAAYRDAVEALRQVRDGNIESAADSASAESEADETVEAAETDDTSGEQPTQEPQIAAAET